MAVVLLPLGAHAERTAFATVQSGRPRSAAWNGFVGVMALFFAYLMATDTLRPPAPG